MGLKKGWKKVVRKTPQYKALKGLKKYTGSGQKGGDDYRSEAAGQLMSENVTKQAGSGQIKYTNEYMA